MCCLIFLLALCGRLPRQSVHLCRRWWQCEQICWSRCIAATQASWRSATGNFRNPIQSWCVHLKWYTGSLLPLVFLFILKTALAYACFNASATAIVMQQWKMINFLSVVYSELELYLWPYNFNGFNVTVTMRQQHLFFIKIVIVLTLAQMANVNRTVSPQGLFGM